MLADGERSAGELVEAFPELSQPAVSRHLRILRDAGLVSVRIDGQHRMYQISPGPLSEVDEWLARYRRFWSGALDALVAHVSARKAEQDPT